MAIGLDHLIGVDGEDPDSSVFLQTEGSDEQESDGDDEDVTAAIHNISRSGGGVGKWDSRRTRPVRATRAKMPVLDAISESESDEDSDSDVISGTGDSSDDDESDHNYDNREETMTAQVEEISDSSESSAQSQKPYRKKSKVLVMTSTAIISNKRKIQK